MDFQRLHLSSRRRIAHFFPRPPGIQVGTIAPSPANCAFGPFPMELCHFRQFKGIPKEANELKELAGTGAQIR